MKRSRKVNARITLQVDKKLQEMVRSTGSSMSEIIMRAIESYHAQGITHSMTTPYEIAKQAGLIGCASGPGDLSVRYKELLTEDLEKKYGHS